MDKFPKIEVLQTHITAMAAAGDAAQEKVTRVVSYSPLILTNTYNQLLFQGGSVSEGSTIEASDTQVEHEERNLQRPH